MKEDSDSKNPTIISAWICAGKTYLTKKHKNPSHRQQPSFIVETT